MSDHVYSHCRLATMVGDGGYGLVEKGALAVRDGRIAWAGAAGDMPEAYAEAPTTDLGGALVTPALIDCHTHLVFGGDRAREFALRLEGARYEEIARAGGGIRSTVAATRAASDEDLLASALRRTDDLLADGVAVIEVKSGYGLSIKEEMRLLRIARRLEEHRPVRIRTTWLAAHALPDDYADRADAYIDEIAIPGLRQAHEAGLVDAVDGFCEGIGFTPAQIRRVFEAAHDLGLPVKLHAEQLSDLKGAVLASEFRAL